MSENTQSTYWVDLIESEVKILQGRYRTRVLQAGEGPTLLLLHGTGGHLENYARNIAALARHFHVVAFDFIWHGRSQKEGYSPEIIPSLVDHVADVLDTLGIRAAHLAGQSLGGWVAMRFALCFPERVNKLVLITPMGYSPEEGAIPGYEEPDWKANLPSSLDMLSNPSYNNVKARMGRILANPDALTNEAILVRQALYQQPELVAVQRPFITEYLSGNIITKHIVRDSHAKEIKQPTLVYWGDKNRTPPSLGEHIAKTIPNGRFFCAEDTGHWAQFESAETFNKVVIDFLNEK